MEFTTPTINQVIIHGWVLPKTLISFDRVHECHKVKQGSVCFRYADLTLKVTRTGYVFIHLFGKIPFRYNSLETELLPLICQFISLHGNQVVERFTYCVKNIHIACASNLKNQELLNYFRSIYGSHPVAGYEVFIVDTEGAPLSLEAPVFSYSLLRIKITRYCDRPMRCVFSFTYTGNVTVILSNLSDLPSVKEILEGWGSMLQL